MYKSRIYVATLTRVSKDPTLTIDITGEIHGSPKSLPKKGGILFLKGDRSEFQKIQIGFVLKAAA